MNVLALFNKRSRTSVGINNSGKIKLKLQTKVDFYDLEITYLDQGNNLIFKNNFH